MPENNKTQEFLHKLAPCIERGELEKCVEEAVRVAGEMGIEALELVNLSAQIYEDEKYKLMYIVALAGVPFLEAEKKAIATSNAGIAAQFIILISMLIFILFYHQLGKFKAGPIEFEKSTEHRSQPLETIAKIER